MKITLTSSTGSIFAACTNFEKANVCAKAIWKRQHHSDIYYDLEFNPNVSISGQIDIEPQEHFAPNKDNIITWHFKTFWTNIIEQSDKYPMMKINPEEFKMLLLHLAHETGQHEATKEFFFKDNSGREYHSNFNEIELSRFPNEPCHSSEIMLHEFIINADIGEVWQTNAETITRTK